MVCFFDEKDKTSKTLYILNFILQIKIIWQITEGNLAEYVEYL